MEKQSKKKINLLDKAKTLPRSSGCYLMKDKLGDIIYVGKAKALPSRVSSYFNHSAKSAKTIVLVDRIEDFDFVLTQTETEALILENTLIKKYMPKYNIRLRDDKSYPYIVINRNEPYPRLEYKRRFKRSKGLEVYGPFVSGSNISEVLRVLRKSFQLRDCSLREFNSRKEPCLLYQIEQCSAPCIDIISAQDYERDLSLTLNFFKGKGKKSLSVLNDRMIQAAQDERFELAAMLRDNIAILDEFLNFSDHRNVEFSQGNESVDVISYHASETEVDIAIYLVRGGILLGHKNFNFNLTLFKENIEENIEEDIQNFLFQYYQQSNDEIPKNIVSNLELDKGEQLSEAISLSLSTSVSFKKPGNKFKSIASLALQQAVESQRVRIENQESVFVGLNKLKDLLSLKELPILLECYDVAIFQGSSPAASQIVYHEGRPDKSSYRYYSLKERPEGNNDFHMMKEVLERRVKKGNYPDVFIVDGGKGQVSMFQEVLKDFDLKIPVVGIAKAKVKGAKGERSEERLIIPGRLNPYLLSKNMSLFRIIVSMRDEAHRFSRKLHHKSEKKKLITSWVDQISGVGPKTRQTILSNMKKSREELALMNVQELEFELGISERISKVIFQYLKEFKPN